MVFRDSVRCTDDVVAPTLDDDLVRAASRPIGGPLGDHARSGLSWWTPVRVVLAIAAVFFALGVVQKSPCVVTNWADDASPKPFSHMCYTDIPYLYVGRGFAEGVWPYEPQNDLPLVKRPETEVAYHDLTLEYPVLTGLWMGAAAAVTNAIGRSPDLSAIPHDEVGTVLDVQYDTAIYWAVNAVGFFLVLLGGLFLLVRAQRRRPWDAMLIAAAPVLPLAATINWDILAVGCVCAFLWAWATRRPVLAGLLIGIGAATKLYPLFFLGPLLILCVRERRLGVYAKTVVAAAVAWLVIDLPIYIWSPDAFTWFWRFNASRGADYGSLWLIASEAGHTASPHVINVTTWVFFGCACLLVALLALLAPRRPRLVQLLFLVVAAFLFVNKVYSPQYVLWLLPLAALARPRWRDLLIWQASEVFYFFAVWMHIANFMVPAGAFDTVYAISIVVRILGEFYLVVMVVRDVLSPWHDPVRADGLSDDPLGGIFDDGIDSEPVESEPTSAGLVAEPAGSADDDVVDKGGGVPDPDDDLVPGAGGLRGLRDEHHAHLHVRRLDEPALAAVDDVRRQRPPGRIEPATGQRRDPLPG